MEENQVDNTINFQNLSKDIAELKNMLEKKK